MVASTAVGSRGAGQHFQRSVGVAAHTTHGLGDAILDVNVTKVLTNAKPALPRMLEHNSNWLFRSAGVRWPIPVNSNAFGPTRPS